jgi:hypothetical protein
MALFGAIIELINEEIKMSETVLERPIDTFESVEEPSVDIAKEIGSLGLGGVVEKIGEVSLELDDINKEYRNAVYDLVFHTAAKIQAQEIHPNKLFDCEVDRRATTIYGWFVSPKLPVDKHKCSQDTGLTVRHFIQFEDDGEVCPCISSATYRDGQLQDTFVKQEIEEPINSAEDAWQRWFDVRNYIQHKIFDNKIDGKEYKEYSKKGEMKEYVAKLRTLNDQDPKEQFEEQLAA